MALIARLNKHAQLGRPARWLVQNAKGLVVGLLERWPTTDTEIHPWKAYGGTGAGIIFLGSFYDDSAMQLAERSCSVKLVPFDRDNCTGGGKRAALAAITKYVQEVGDLLPTAEVTSV